MRYKKSVDWSGPHKPAVEMRLVKYINDIVAPNIQKVQNNRPIKLFPFSSAEVVIFFQSSFPFSINVDYAIK